MASQTQITINGKEYALDTLSDVAKTNLASLRVADQEIARLRQQLALVETARRVFARGVAQNLPGEPATQEA